LQPGPARLVQIRYIQAEKIDHALIEEDWLAVRSEPPDVAWNHGHELREFPLPLAQFRLGNSVRVEIGRRPVPPRDTAVPVACRHDSGSIPVVDARRAPDAAIEQKRIAGLKAVTPCGRDAVIVVGMGRPFEERMTFIHRGLELLQRYGDES